MVKTLTSLFSGRFVLGDITPLVNRRVYGTLRRRLSDRVADVFKEACLGGDLETAEQLLAVMQDMQDRQASARSDRRSDDAELERAKNRANFAFFERMDNPMDRANFIGTYESLANSFRYGIELHEKAQQVTSAQLQQVAKK